MFIKKKKSWTLFLSFSTLVRDFGVFEMGNYVVQVWLCYWPVFLLHFFSFLSGFSFTDTDDSPYVSTLPFWTGVCCFQRAAPSSRLLLKIPFWDDPGLNVRYLWIFQVDHIFYKLDVKILATSNEIRCVRCSYPPSSSWTVDPCQ